MNKNIKKTPEDMDLSRAVPSMPPSFRRRIQDTCENLPERQPVALRRGVIATAAVFAAVALLLLTIGFQRPESFPDTVTPLSQTTANDAENSSGNGDGYGNSAVPVKNTPSEPVENTPSEPAENTISEPLSGDDAEQLMGLYAYVWPFESTVYPTPDDDIFEGTVYLYEDTFDPYYHVDPEKCGAGTKDDMVKTIRQMAYRRYEREICITCALERDLELMMWLNEGGRYYHKEQECRGEVMQVHTTLKNAVEIYDVPSLCPYCSGIARDDDAEMAHDFIIDLNWSTYEFTLNAEWAGRDVWLTEGGVYHYDAACSEGDTEKMSQLSAVRDHKAVPCGECMGAYTRNLAVYYSDGDAQYHALSLCGGKQLSVKAFQYAAMEQGMTLCPECFKDY